MEAGTLGITYDAGESAVGASAVATVRSPSGEARIVPLNQSGESTFSGSVAALEPGAYWVAVSLERSDGSNLVSSAGAVSGYAEEFAFREPDLVTFNAAAETTGGRMNIVPEMAFDEAPARGAALQSLAPWLLAAALALFFVDVALRRLVFSTDDVGEWRAGVQSETRRERRRIDKVIEESKEAEAPPPVVSGSETLERLMRRKRR